MIKYLLERNSHMPCGYEKAYWRVKIIFKNTSYMSQDFEKFF